MNPSPRKILCSICNFPNREEKEILSVLAAFSTAAKGIGLGKRKKKNWLGEYGEMKIEAGVGSDGLSRQDAMAHNCSLFLKTGVDKKVCGFPGRGGGEEKNEKGGNLETPPRYI